MYKVYYRTDEEDIVAAFIDDELRGRAYVEYFPHGEVEDYLAYLTVYGDTTERCSMDTIRLEVWDASACLRYGEVQENFTFYDGGSADRVGGSAIKCCIHTNSLILREIPLGHGWNWLSFNLTFPDNSLNAALAVTRPSLNNPIIWPASQSHRAICGLPSGSARVG